MPMQRLDMSELEKLMKDDEARLRSIGIDPSRFSPQVRHDLAANVGLSYDEVMAKIEDDEQDRTN